jgi:hypothetical protein
MNTLAELRSINGTTTIVGYDFDSSFEELVETDQVDSYIVATEDGFAPLGHWKGFFSKALGVNKNKIGMIADWNRFKNSDVSLIGLPNQGPDGKLRGVVLAASEASRCYEQFATPRYGNPYRDFYYNVAYESISYAVNTLGAKKLAMSHLSASHHFHEDIASCIAEALAHFCDEPNTPQIDSFLFVGCCIEKAHLSGIQRLNKEGTVTRHQDIQINKSEKDGFEVITLNWKE